jgi:tRNA nucleotidyltransferase (CCA-adding enzyme)
LASARSETYARPGALPTVNPGNLNDDLFRRDFTINAMAVELNPEGCGLLIDLYNGQNDLRQGLIRILHEKSFIDDSTRIWRGLRYEQRLDFQLESETLRRLKQDISMLDTVSGDRIRYELECILNEELPEKVFRRADELGVLKKLSPSLKGDGWLAEKFQQAREASSPNQPPISLYLALLTYNMESEPRDKLISYLKLDKTLARTLHDTAGIKDKIPQLADAKLKPSAIYHLLECCLMQSLVANLIAGDSAIANQNIKLYMEKLRTMKPILTGEDLIKMGIPQGPRIKETLGRLLDARLDGKVKTRRDEEGLVKTE